MSTGTSLGPLAPYIEDLLLWDQPLGEPVYQIPQSVAASVILTDCSPLLPVQVKPFAAGLGTKFVLAFMQAAFDPTIPVLFWKDTYIVHVHTAHLQRSC